MSEPDARRGAAAVSGFAEPVIDLVRLTALAARLLAPPAGAPGHLFDYDRHRNSLTIDPSPALRRLIQDSTFKTLSSPKDGLLQFPDESAAPAAAGIVVGARIADGSEDELAARIKALVQAVDRDLDRCLAATAGSLPLKLNADLAVPALAGQILGEQGAGRYLNDLKAARTRVQQVRFQRHPEDGAAGQVVARVVTALEEVEGGDLRDQLRASLSRQFQEMDEDGREAAIDEFVVACDRDTSPQYLLLRVIEDQGLSRIRMAVSFRLMDSLGRAARRKIAEGRASAAATSGYALLAEYFSRVRRLFAVLVEEGEAEVEINASALYGMKGQVALPEQLHKTGFFQVLPVGPDWLSQTAEVRLGVAEAGLPSAVRSLDFHFKINGINPQDPDRRPAYLARLARIGQVLGLDAEAAADEVIIDQRLPRHLAQLVFLAAVIPANADEQVDPVAIVQALARRVSHPDSRDRTRQALRELVDELAARADAVARMGGALVRLLRHKTLPLTGGAGEALTYYLCLDKGIIDRDAFEIDAARAMTATDEAGILGHLSVSTSPQSVGTLLSRKVTVRLHDRLIHAAGEPRTASLSRPLQGRLVQVLVREAMPPGQQEHWTRVWECPQGFLEVVFDRRLLGLSGKAQTGDPGGPLRRLAVCRMFFALLVYTALERLVGRLKAADGGRFRLSLLRLQNSGREADDSRADGFVYAFCQALEHTLGRRVPVRMQGITRAVSDADGHKVDLVRRSTLQGLLAGLPLFLESAAVTAGPVGLVSFATRPSDVRFGVTAPGQTGYVFVGRSYMAMPQAGPPSGYLLHPGPHVFDGAWGEEAFRSPNGVCEVMADLCKKGCRHILLLGRHYGGRHIGRTATRHRHHDSPEFIADLFLRFPGVYIYPLWREVFYATRLHRRDKAREDAFDISHWNDHMDGHMELFIKKILGSPEIASNALPVYTLATLHVVARAGDDDALEKPQSGFCAYFLLHDAFDPRRPEASAAHRHNLEVFTGDDPQPRDALTAVLRAVHYMEAEKIYTATAEKDQPRCAAPVLDAYPWSAPASRNGAGEIVWVRSRRRTVYLSLTGLLARIAPVVGMVAARRPGP